MRLPDGQLVRSRVVTELRTAFVDALDRELTGYAVLEPQAAVLLESADRGVVTFEGGVPIVAYHTGTDRGGPPALADLAAGGPYRLELVAVDPADLAAVHDVDRFRVPPAMPAERLVGDQRLADRTRAAAPDSRLDAPDSRSGTSDARTATTPAGAAPGADTDADFDREGTASRSGMAADQPGAVEAFLEDEEKIEAIREAAREEAQERAEEWGFDV